LEGLAFHGGGGVVYARCRLDVGGEREGEVVKFSVWCYSAGSRLKGNGERSLLYVYNKGKQLSDIDPGIASSGCAATDG
jgi:hypothetical protein